MAYSKTFLLLGLLFVVVLIMSSEVSARDLAEEAQTKESMQTDDAEPFGYGHEHEHEHGHEHDKPGHGNHPEESEKMNDVEPFGYEHEHHHGHWHGKPPGHGGDSGEKPEVKSEGGGN